MNTNHIIMTSDQKNETKNVETTTEPVTKTKKTEHKPSRLKTPRNKGVYIPSQRVKGHLGKNGINKIYDDAIEELQKSDPDLNPGASLVEISKMSSSTKFVIDMANQALEKRQADREKKIAAGKIDLKKEAAEKEEKLKQLESKRQQAIADGKPVKKPKKITVYSDMITEISKLKFRLSEFSSLQLAASICAAMHELLGNGMMNAIADKAKIVKVDHILRNINGLSFASFYRDTDPWKSAEKNEKERCEQEILQKSLKKKNQKNPNSGGAYTGVKISDKKKSNTINDRNTDLVKKQPPEFEHYIRGICHNIMNSMVEDRKQTEYDGIKISANVKLFCSNIIIEFLKNFSRILKGQLHLMSDKKTVTSEIIRTLVNQYLLIDYVNDQVECDVKIQKKIEMFKSFTEQKSKEKKEAKLAHESAQESSQVSD